MRLKTIAQETVKALNQGTYETESGQAVNLAPLVQRCFQGTRFYTPGELADLRDQVLAQPALATSTAFDVVNETTLQGCARLVPVVAAGGFERLAALNFASAKHPGGGFLGGAKAQEESLARSSGLYKSLLRYPAFYEFHRQQHTSLYSDRMIYSPDCPIFRTDDGAWLDQPHMVDFLTSPAPNAGAIRSNEPRHVKDIEQTFRERIDKLLALAAHHGCDLLILGAWGCGAFRNDPELVAQLFKEHLRPGGLYWGRFRKIVFSVLDTSPTQATFNAFASRFSDLA